MNLGLLDQLIALVEHSCLRELVYTSGSTSIRLVKREDAARRDIIRSSEAGVFHSNHPLAGRAPARQGEVVAQGQILAYVRVGAVLRPVVAPHRGRIGRQLLTDGAVAGCGDPLYSFEVFG